MALFMCSLGYTPEVWAGLIRSPENRQEAVSRILEDAGCKLQGLWYAFGEGDGFAKHAASHSGRVTPHICSFQGEVTE